MQVEALGIASELWELVGGQIGLFSLKTRGQTPSGEAHKFLEVLFHDQGGSIADIVPADLSVHAGTSDATAITDCFMRSGWVIVSTAFKQLVERFNVPNTEFFPLKVITIAAGVDYAFDDWEPGETIDGYWLMNCSNRVDVKEYVDVAGSDLVWQKSFAGHRPPWFRTWRKLVLKKPIQEHLFGFTDNMPMHRYVSRRFRDAAEASGLRAGIYVRPLQWPN